MNIGYYKHTLDNTLTIVKNFSIKYHTDTNNIKYLSLDKFFDYVKDLEYIADPKGFEFVMRPKILMERGGGDCDDKTVLCLAWFINNNISCGYSVVSQKAFKPYHHIFPFFIDNKGKKFDFDATYSQNKIFQKRKWFKRKDTIIYEKEV